MSQNSKEPPKGKEKKDEGLPNGCYLAFVIVFLIFFVAMCTRGCGGGSGDDRWDYLEHKVNTDSYYDQW